MNIEEINRQHLIKQDMFYRVGYGLASRIINYESGIIYLELEIRSKWKNSIDVAVEEIAYSWRDNHPELAQAVACKVKVIDSKKFPYKRTLLHLGIVPGPDVFKAILFDKKPSLKFS